MILVVITLRAAAAERDADLTRMLVVLFGFIMNETGDRQAHTTVFVCAMEERALRAQFNGWQGKLAFLLTYGEERKMKEIYPQPLY